MSWLRDTFSVLHPDATEVNVIRHTRVYILQLMDRILFVDKLGTLVHRSSYSCLGT